jgi:hypothetical protein
MESDYYKKKPEEVTEELVVLVHGIHPELDGPLEELVNWDITTELNKTRKSIELGKPKETELKTMLLLQLI